MERIKEEDNRRKIKSNEKGITEVENEEGNTSELKEGEWMKQIKEDCNRN